MEQKMRRENKLVKVFIHPEKDGFQNVIRKVTWEIISNAGDTPETQIKSIVETELDTSNLSQDSFILVEDMSTTEILNKAIEAQGGQEFIDSIRATQEEYVMDKLLKNSLSEYDFSNNPT